MNTFIQVYLDTILNLVVCAEDFGFTTLYGDFAQMTGWVSDEQINEYVHEHYTLSEDYAEEDEDNARQALYEWRKSYMDYMNDDMTIEN